MFYCFQFEQMKNYHKHVSELNPNTKKLNWYGEQCIIAKSDLVNKTINMLWGMGPMYCVKLAFLALFSNNSMIHEKLHLWVKKSDILF